MTVDPLALVALANAVYDHDGLSTAQHADNSRRLARMVLDMAETPIAQTAAAKLSEVEIAGLRAALRDRNEERAAWREYAEATEKLGDPDERVMETSERHRLAYAKLVGLGEIKRPEPGEPK